MEATNELSKTLGADRECDREPINLIPAIQSHGYLLVFEPDEFRVRNVSVNTAELFKVPVEEILNTRIDNILSSSITSLVKKEILTLDAGQNGRQLYSMPEPPYPHLDAYLYRVGNLFGLELERRLPEGEIMLTTDGILKDYWSETKNIDSVEQLSQITCRTIRRITGLDRVMIYKFLPPEMHGEVIGEDKVIHTATYMRHRFPSSDIPRPARDLYLRNQTRLIANVNSESIAIEPKQNLDARGPLDLRDSRLRAVPSVHLEYLRNMGVEGSFSVAVTIADELWGLICCHHLKPIQLSQPQRALCEIVGHAFALQVTRLETLHKAHLELGFQTSLRKVFEDLRDSREPLSDLFKRHRSIEDIFETTGMALISQNHCDMAGLTLPSKDMTALANLVQAKMKNENKTILSSRHLREFGEQWVKYKELACGILAIHIPMDDSIFMLFRPEVVKAIVWGGDPRKALAKRTFSGSLNPRASFDSWEEIVRGESQEWLPHQMDGAVFLRDFIFDGLAKKEKQIQELYNRNKPAKS